MTDNGSWTVVSRNTKKNKTPPVASPTMSSNLLPSRLQTKIVKQPIVIEVKPEFYETLDELSLLVFSVLYRNCKETYGWPASAIKKEINAIISSKSYPTYLSESKQALLKDEYLKKDIGWALYDGPLKNYLVCNKGRTGLPPLPKDVETRTGVPKQVCVSKLVPPRELVKTSPLDVDAFGSRLETVDSSCRVPRLWKLNKKLLLENNILVVK
jgi:hypothetical protein